MNLKKYIIDIPDFPQQGIIFKDITPLLNNATAFKTVIDKMVAYAHEVGATVILAPEARGFLFGPAVSYAANLRFIPVRKPDKLPRATVKAEYALEYGTNTLEIHEGDLQPNDKVLIIDDVLATGGTAKAICELVTDQQAQVVGMMFLINLTFLNGNDQLKDYPHRTIIEY